MIESAFVFDMEGNLIHWHLPAGRTAGSIPDSRDLWEVLWENKDIVGGVAHTHPWNGPAVPSHTDITTFRAVEQGLGKFLFWPVVTFDTIAFYVYVPVIDEYIQTGMTRSITRRGESPFWDGVEELRRLSGAKMITPRR